MSTSTMTMTLPRNPTHDNSGNCPHCGTGLSLPLSQTAVEAQRQIEDLQAQVRLLTQKATAAVDRWADYEDELRTLRAQQQQQQQQGQQQQQHRDSSEIQRAAAATPPPTSSTPSTSYQNRLSYFLSPRKSAINLGSNSNSSSTPPPLHRTSTPTAIPGAFPAAATTVPAAAAAPASSSSSTPTLPSTTANSTITNNITHEAALVAALAHEQQLRQQAEGKLDAAHGELEDLSTQLFQQANEMVATERKARARLEARVEVLEQRDGEKRRRLERLEGALARIERVRGLLAAREAAV